MIPYGRQSISQSDIQSVHEVLTSDWLTQGPAVEMFETAVATYCGAKYAVSVCNATSALHLACKALDLQAGDYVWTSPNTFVASANCALYCNAKIDFVDIDPLTLNMSIEKLEDKLKQAAKKGCLPKIVIPVDFAGRSCDLKAMRELADHYQFHIIEDASHAIGGLYQHERIGNGRYADITVFSFHPVKLITTGEGGMALTNNPLLYKRLSLLRSHGITRSADDMVSESHGAWYYQQMELGYNYRMTDIQAALGSSQLKKLDEFIARRKQLVHAYHHAFELLPITVPAFATDGESAWHLYVIQLHEAEKRNAIFQALREAGIFVNVHYIPVHTQPFYQRLGFKTGDFPCAENYYARAISLPLYYGLSDEQQQYVIDKLTEQFA